MQSFLGTKLTSFQGLQAIALGKLAMRKRPGSLCAVGVQPTDLYFSSAFQMSCKLLNAYEFTGGVEVAEMYSVPETILRMLHFRPGSYLPLDVLAPKCSLFKS